MLSEPLLQNCSTTITTSSEEENAQTKSGIIGASFNLSNTIVGAGIVGLPYAFNQGGILSGIFLLMLVGYLTSKSSILLVHLSNFHPALKPFQIKSFEELMYYPFGNAGKKFVIVNMFICAYGAMVAYLLIIKDTMSVILGFTDGWQPEYVLLVITFFIVVPICLQEHMASLALTSTLSMMCDMILIIILTIVAPIPSTAEDNGGIKEVITSNAIKPNVFIALGVISTAMCCQQSLIIIFKSLSNNEIQRRWENVTYFSITFATIFGIWIGTVGYLGYMDGIDGNVMNNLDDDSIVANVARGLLAITIIFTYPMEFYVTRHILMQLIYDIQENDNIDNENQNGNRKCYFSSLQKVSIYLTILSLIPALLFDDLGIVLSFPGVTGASCLSYIGPGLVYVGVYGDSFLQWSYGLFHISNYEEENDLLLTQILQNEQNTTLEQSKQQTPSYCQIFLYYTLGFPLWNKIACIGYQGMQIRSRNDDVSIKQPTCYDFIIAIFFMCFGCIAFVAGVFSDFYLLINGQ